MSCIHLPVVSVCLFVRSFVRLFVRPEARCNSVGRFLLSKGVSVGSERRRVSQKRFSGNEGLVFCLSQFARSFTVS